MVLSLLLSWAIKIKWKYQNWNFEKPTKGIAVSWNECEMKTGPELRLSDSSTMTVHFPWWIDFRQRSVMIRKPHSLACPPCSPLGLLLGLSICFFLPVGLYQSIQFYMYLNLLLAKNQVSPLRVPSVWIFIYSFINIFNWLGIYCVPGSPVRCWECSSKQDRHSLTSMDCSLTRRQFNCDLYYKGNYKI